MRRIRTRMRKLILIGLETSTAASGREVLLYGKDCSRDTGEELIRCAYQMTGSVFSKSSVYFRSGWIGCVSS